MSDLSEAIARNRRRIEELEAPAVAQMESLYRNAIDDLRADLHGVTQLIDQARLDGVNVNPDWLRRQARYERLIDQAQTAFERFARDGGDVVGELDVASYQEGAAAALDLADAVGIDTDIFGGDINVEALEHVAAAFGPDSPLNASLDFYGVHGREVIENELFSGMARGLGGDEIVRNIRGELDSPFSLSRLHSLVRTEAMNAYRDATTSVYQEMGDVLESLQWSAARSPLTCLACLAMDGQTFPVDDPPDKFHVRCRCVLSPYPADMDQEVLEALGEIGTGAEWFAQQPAATQQAMIGNRQAWEAYDRGDLTLDDFLGERDDGLWGTSVYQKSGRRVLKEKGLWQAPKPKPKAAPLTPYTTAEVVTKTKAEAAALYARHDATVAEWEQYKGSGYWHVNAELRKGNTPHGFNDLMEPYGNYQLDQPATLYRGTRFVRGSTLDAEFAGLVPGDGISDAGFVSTSVSIDVSRGFAMPGTHQNGYVVELAAPRNTKYIPIDFGKMSSEDELVLPPGTVFLVTEELAPDGLGRRIYRSVPLPPGSDVSAMNVHDPALHDEAAEMWRNWKP